MYPPFSHELKSLYWYTALRRRRRRKTRNKKEEKVRVRIHEQTQLSIQESFLSVEQQNYDVWVSLLVICMDIFFSFCDDTFNLSSISIKPKK